MNLAMVLAPVFLQVALTFGLLVWAGRLRVAAVSGGAVRVRDVALGEPNWPGRVTQVTNAYENQLELPVLFYVLVVLALFTAHMSVTLAVLAWLFVASRCLHALIHVTTNELRRRFFLFLAGVAILLLMWLLFALDVLFGRM